MIVTILKKHFTVITILYMQEVVPEFRNSVIITIVSQFRSITIIINSNNITSILVNIILIVIIVIIIVV